MKIAGIIAEYNPFHTGHAYHIQKTKEQTDADTIIVVMSGSFVQRGAPAIFDKWSRTQMALQNGADLVIELPVLFATSSAETFAAAGVKLLNDTGVTDILSFGTETPNIENLQRVAAILATEPPLFRTLLKENLDKGFSFPVARSLALEILTGLDKNFFAKPNNILAMEYLKSLQLQKSDLLPIAIKRQGASYHDTKTKTIFASATGLRKAWNAGDMETIFTHTPKNCHTLFNQQLSLSKTPISLSDFTQALQYTLRCHTKKSLSLYNEVTEGLENRIFSTMETAFSYLDIVSTIQTKRYPQTKVQRMLLHILLGIQKTDVTDYTANGFSPYLRVLGFRKERDDLLSLLTKQSKIPILTNLKNADKILTEQGKKMLSLEKRATDLYAMASPGKHNWKPNQDFTRPMVIFSETKT